MNIAAGTGLRVEVRFPRFPGVRDTARIDLTTGITVLTGRNNVGKTRLLTGVRDTMVALSGTLVPVPEVWVQDGPLQWKVAIDEQNKLITYEVTDYERRTVVTAEVARDQDIWVLRTSAGQSRNLDVLSDSVPTMASVFIHLPSRGGLVAALERLVYLPPQRVIPAMTMQRPVPIPSPNGSDLGNALLYHQTRRTQQFSALENVLRAMYPEIAYLWFEIDQQSLQVTTKYRDLYSDSDVTLEQVGTGVGQVLHIIASVFLHPPGRIFLIDEPHAFLHPTVERLLVELFREHNEHWYVCATHSPVFINEAQPDHTWLVTRDSEGTSVRSVFDERLPRKEILSELGVRAGDVALAERVILVEGPGDEEVYPILLRTIGWDPAVYNCAVVPIRGAGTTRPIAQAVSRLAQLLQVRFTICLDGDKKEEYSDLQAYSVRFLHVRELEDLFLADAEALHDGLLEALGAVSPDSVHEAAMNWSVKRVAQEIEVWLAGGGTKASSLLNRLAHEMGFHYSKRAHGSLIGERLPAETLSGFRDALSDFFPTATR